MNNESTLLPAATAHARASDQNINPILQHLREFVQDRIDTCIRYELDEFVIDWNNVHHEAISPFGHVLPGHVVPDKFRALITTELQEKGYACLPVLIENTRTIRTDYDPMMDLTTGQSIGTCVCWNPEVIARMKKDFLVRMVADGIITMLQTSPRIKVVLQRSTSTRVPYRRNQKVVVVEAELQNEIYEQLAKIGYQVCPETGLVHVAAPSGKYFDFIAELDGVKSELITYSMNKVKYLPKVAPMKACAEFVTECVREMLVVGGFIPAEQRPMVIIWSNGAVIRDHLKDRPVEAVVYGANIHLKELFRKELLSCGYKLVPFSAVADSVVPTLPGLISVKHIASPAVKSAAKKKPAVKKAVVKAKRVAKK